MRKRKEKPSLNDMDYSDGLIKDMNEAYRLANASCEPIAEFRKRDLKNMKEGILDLIKEYSRTKERPKRIMQKIKKAKSALQINIIMDNHLTFFTVLRNRLIRSEPEISTLAYLGYLLKKLE